ncbi:DUF6538 domain-containing protein [Azospirillum canadense]|uniref:DUF6538 domain-containing protein n=1 Tax=Azospirillum canadense TaxID=403962 RepID=UPI002227E37E|nr:DUF6538 domain-containing protein [Azospirillum canadense]MCW2237466.1 integrase [Azospirillum canadense]
MSNRFLRSVGGRRIFRRRIPTDLIDRFGGQREIVRSLGALPHAEAIAKARRLTVATDRLFQMIARKPELDREQIAELAEEFFAELVEDFDRARRRDFSDIDHLEQAQHSADRRADGAMELLRFNDTSAAAEAAQALLEAHGIAVDRASPAFADLSRAVLRAYAEAARIQAARVGGDYTVRPSDPLLARALTAERQPQRQKKGLPTLSEAWGRFSAEKIKASSWRPSMAHDAEQALALFTESAGDRRLDRYERTDVSSFVAMLQALPAHRSKKPAFKGKSLAELVAMTKADPSLETLAPKTVKKYANLVSSFFGWGVAQGYIRENIASAVYRAPKRTVRRNEERDAWSGEQLKTLFSSPLYQGAKSTTRRSESGAVVVRDADWWLPVLGLFHPCRLEELAQLRVEDVKEQDGILYFDIHADDSDGDDKVPGRRLKSLAAVRKVPVHHVALELGFQEYVAERRRKGDVMLWPELEPGGIAQRYGFAYSKRFGRYRKAVGLDGVDFHSLRHNSITALVQSQVHPDIISALSGHEVPGERGRYSKGADLPDLKTAIDRIMYPGINVAVIAKP